MTKINSTKPKINEKFIINVQGTDFVKYEGLLDLAHQKGLKSIYTEILQLPDETNGNTCIVKAICKTENGEFHGIGDAAPNSVNRMITPHLIRMAETRSKARALRDLTNVGMTALEELGENESFKSNNKMIKSNQFKCSACLNPITAQENNYSLKVFKRPLCRSCQGKFKK